LLKEDKEEERSFAVGLHPFFSPLFNINFRYPFYFPQHVSRQDFISIFRGDKKDAEKAMNSIIKGRMINYARRHRAISMRCSGVQRDFLPGAGEEE